MKTSEVSALRIRLMTLLIIVGVFASGGVMGAVIYRWGASGRAPGVPHGRGVSLWLPLDELNLTPEQDAKVRVIVDRRRGELEAIIQESFPRVRAINELMQKEVRAVLTPAQQRKLEELEQRGPLGPTPTWQKRLDDLEGEPAPALQLEPGSPPPPR